MSDILRKPFPLRFHCTTRTRQVNLPATWTDLRVQGTAGVQMAEARDRVLEIRVCRTVQAVLRRVVLRGKSLTENRDPAARDKYVPFQNYRKHVEELLDTGLERRALHGDPQGLLV